MQTIGTQKTRKPRRSTLFAVSNWSISIPSRHRWLELAANSNVFALPALEALVTAKCAHASDSLLKSPRTGLAC